MFFKKKQKKLDSKVRFQHSKFTSQLNAARSFKRQSAPVPEGRVQLFLSKIGMRSWFARIVVVIIFLLGIYLVFIPNFLFVKTITVHGVAPDDASKIESITREYFGKSLWPVPQQSSIFLSESKLSDYLLANSDKIYKIEQVTTHFPSELEIVIVPRKPRYVLRAQDRMFVINNDGSVASQSPYDQAQFTEGLSQTMTRVIINAKHDASEGQNFFPDKAFSDQLQILRDLFMAKITVGISYFEIPTFLETTPPAPAQSSSSDDEEGEPKINTALPDQSKQINWQEIIVHTKKDPNQTTFLPLGYSVLFDRSLDISETLDKLAVLLGKMEAGRRSNLFYIDMRLRNRGFVCLRGASCSFEIKDPFTPEILVPVDADSVVIPEVIIP